MVQVTIREARIEDAGAMIEYMQALTSEQPPVDVLIEAGEFKATVEEEEGWIRRHLEADNSVLLMAVEEESGELVGVLNCVGGQRRRAMRHAATLGVSVRKGWRDQGIGRAMMERAIEWARGNGVIRRVQLEVFTRNARGRHLYESVGFVEEGIRRRAFRKDGEWIDAVMMGMMVE